MDRYLRILRFGPALRPFVASVIARLSISMAPLGMVLLVQQERGAYAVAGLVTAAFALGTAAGGPFWGALMDRLGQPAVVAGTSLASAALVAAVAVGTTGGAPVPVLMVLAAGAGLAFPPLSPAMRAAWRTVLPHTPDRQAAFALDAVAVETVFIGGPLLLSLLLVVAPPAVPLLATAGLLAGGGTAYSLTGAARRWRAEPHAAGTGRRGRSPLSVPGVLAVLVAAAVMSVGFGHTDVSIAATARDALGAESRLGLLFAAIAGGSVVGGLLYGARTWRRPERERLPVTLAGFAAGLATLPLVVHGATTRLGLLLPLLFVTGLFIAPSLIVQQSLVDEMSPQDRLGEAQAWLGTAITAGAAAGTAVAGVLVDLGGPGRSFLGAASAVALAAVVAVVARPPGPE